MSQIWMHKCRSLHKMLKYGSITINHMGKGMDKPFVDGEIKLHAFVQVKVALLRDSFILWHSSQIMLGTGISESQANARAAEMARRVAEKRRELDKLKELERYSRELAQELAVMGERFETLTQGTESKSKIGRNAS